MFPFLQYMIFVITTVIVFAFCGYLNLAYFLDISKHKCFNNINDLEVYEYIVVGAGTAGATLSARLAERGYKTLLLEAGGIAPFFLDIPLLAPLIQNTPYDWQYVTVPQQNACKGLVNNQSKWPMGKIVGGTSRLNYMLYVLGHLSDFDNWFPDFIEPTIKRGGPMPISNLKWNTGLADVLLQGLEELQQQIANINKSLKDGFMKAQLSIHNGKRWSTDKLIQHNFKNKLNIIPHSHVEKVLIESKRAVGVQFVSLNKTFRAIAKRKIILSAGAIGTPKILLLSGVGPRKHLEDLNIKVINDLPVGQNLVDHILTGVDLVTLNVSIGLSMINTLNPLSAINYFFGGEGPWTSGGVEMLGTFHSSLTINKSNRPDLQLIAMPLGLSKDNGVVLKKAMGISDKVYNEYFAPASYENTVTIAPVLLHPKSTGEVKLNSTDPFDPPLIDPKYLSNKDDVKVLVDGIAHQELDTLQNSLYIAYDKTVLSPKICTGLRFVKKLVETNAMKTIGASIYEKHFPGCESEIFGSTEYWECYIQHLTLTSYHPAGTCRMGDVVDQSFRVYGTRNLYVIDASVLPTLPSGNINAAIVMLAEKAARMFTRNTNNRKSNMKCYKPQNYYYFEN